MWFPLPAWASSSHARHPCYAAFRLEAYIGAPVLVNGKVHGTVNFSSPTPYHREFDDTDREFMALLARWVGSAIEREQAQQLLASNERQLQTIIDTEPECVKLLTPDGRLLQMNRAGLGMIEANSLEQVAWQATSLASSQPAGQGSLPRNSTSESCKAKTGSLEFEIIGLKGGHRQMETHAVPMRDNEGRITSILAVTRDITERKRNEAELELHRRHLEELVQQRTTALMETEARATHIIQSSADGLYGVDAKGLITFINPAACEMLGYTVEQVIGQPGHALFHHSKPDGSPYPLEECPSHSALQPGYQDACRQRGLLACRWPSRAGDVCHSSHAGRRQDDRRGDQLRRHERTTGRRPGPRTGPDGRREPGAYPQRVSRQHES